MPTDPLVARPVNPSFRSNAETRQDVFSTSVGDVIIQWPVGMSEMEHNAVICFLDLVKNQMHRARRPEVVTNAPCEV